MQARKTLRCQKGLTTALPWVLLGIPLVSFQSGPHGSLEVGIPLSGKGLLT